GGAAVGLFVVLPVGGVELAAILAGTALGHGVIGGNEPPHGNDRQHSAPPNPMTRHHFLPLCRMTIRATGKAGNRRGFGPAGGGFKRHYVNAIAPMSSDWCQKRNQTAAKLIGRAAGL